MRNICRVSVTICARLARAGLVGASLLNLLPVTGASAAPAAAGGSGSGHHSRHAAGWRPTWHGAWRDKHHGTRHADRSRSGRHTAPDTTEPDAADSDGSNAAATQTGAASAASSNGAALKGQALVTIAADGVTSTSARVASDLSAVLDDGAIRILPVMSRGSLGDALDLAKADKADLAFLHSDAMASLSNADRAAMAARVTYIARLYNEEIHVVAGRDVADIRSLAGKKVNVGLEGSASAQTARLVFDRLGIAPHYIFLDQPTALTQLAAGEIAADFDVSGHPARALQDFAGDGRFKCLAIPYAPALQNMYLPARLEARDYGNLIPSGASVETLAVATVLAAIDAPANSPRGQRVAKFTDAFFDKFDALRDPMRHPKWREVNLSAEVANWTRFSEAQADLDKAPPPTARSVSVAPPLDATRFTPAPDQK